MTKQLVYIKWHVIYMKMLIKDYLERVSYI
jgi:hypothetical protein